MYEYELDVDGNNTVVKSLDMNQKSFIRFTNKSNRSVDVYWINYKGKSEHYKQLLPRQYFDVNTYTTHPWIFKDSQTNERFVINNKVIFRGQPNLRYNPPQQQNNYILRMNWNITLPLRSLKSAAMITLAKYIHHENLAFSLDLPKSLAQELSELVVLYHSNNK